LGPWSSSGNLIVKDTHRALVVCRCGGVSIATITVVSGDQFGPPFAVD